MGTIQIKQANISAAKMRNDILKYGGICTLGYVAFLFLMKLLHLTQIVELRFFNYFLLFFVTMYEITKWIKQTRGFVPFLQVLGTVLFTGIWSFVLFSGFLYFYNKYDQAFAELFTHETKGLFPAMPAIAILFEGSGASVIVAYIHMQYFRRFEEGESAL